MIDVMMDNEKINVEWVTFSDGAMICKVDPSIKNVKRYIAYAVKPTTPVNQIESELQLITSAVDMLVDLSINRDLLLPYLPYGRADRVFEEGNPAPLHEFLCNIENYNFDYVGVNDPHNEEYIKEYDINWGIKTQLQCFKESIGFNVKSQWAYVIAPDKGATNKAKSIADYLGVPVVQAEKKRNISTGRIESVELLGDIIPTGGRVIIVDDILDNGGTFIPLSEELSSQGFTVDLYVTHLIAAKGLDLFKGLIDNIYYNDIVASYINSIDVMNFNIKQ